MLTSSANVLLDSVPESISSRARLDSFTKEEKERRESVSINKDFFRNHQGKYVELLSPDQNPTTINLTKPITKKRSTMLYQSHLVRTMTGPAISIAALEKIYTEIDIDSIMLKVDQGAELTGTVLVLPFVTFEPEMRIRLVQYDGTMISVVQNEFEPEKADGISIISIVDRLRAPNIYGAQGHQRVIRQQIWTDNAVVIYEGDRLVSSETNELGFIPMVAFRGEEFAGQYLGESPITGVRQLNASINQMMTDLGFTIRMQTASPIALEGYQSSEQIILHPGKAFSLPVGAKATVLDFKPKIAEALEAVAYIEEKVYETSSVPKVSIVGGEGTSGRELLVRWFPLTQVFEEKSVRYQRYELNLANTILRILGLPPLKSMLVDYPDDANLPLTSDEDTLEMDIELGITTPALELVRRNPELSIAEATVMVRQNSAFNKEVISPAVDNTPAGE